MQENPDATDAELVKISMKQWRSLSEDDRKEWNEKAAAAGGNADEKKRKREILENNENDNKITNTVSENSTKKLKCSDNGSGSASSKLAGFAYSKSWDIYQYSLKILKNALKSCFLTSSVQMFAGKGRVKWTDCLIMAECAW